MAQALASLSPLLLLPAAPSAAFALISDYVGNADAGVRCGAILGLGLAYAGTQREEVQELLVPLVRRGQPALHARACLACSSLPAAAERAPRRIFDARLALRRRACPCFCQVLDSDSSMEVAGLAALALGLVFTASTKEDVVEALLTALMTRCGGAGAALVMLCCIVLRVAAAWCSLQ